MNPIPLQADDAVTTGNGAGRFTSAGSADLRSRQSAHARSPNPLTARSRKREAAHAAIDEGKKFLDVAELYNVHHCTLRQVVARRTGMCGGGAKNRDNRRENQTSSL